MMKLRQIERDILATGKIDTVGRGARVDVDVRSHDVTDRVEEGEVALNVAVQVGITGVLRARAEAAQRIRDQRIHGGRRR